MKTILLTSAFLLTAFAASAQTVNTGATANSGSSSGANALVQQYSKGVRNASSAIAPGLIASGLSCSGSAAVGGAGGGWGLSLGVTKADENCDTREDAKYIQGVTGDIGAAKERLCDNKKIAAAFARAGKPCAADVRRVSATSYAQRPKTVRMPMRECLRRGRQLLIDSGYSQQARRFGVGLSTKRGQACHR